MGWVDIQLDLIILLVGVGGSGSRKNVPLADQQQSDCVDFFQD